ncbi:uncharacterized protein LOC105845351 isoform X2 [Hydra vulgaris]|uniref:uncharacterized protein LOC105845351 isoform X2 n=1 Tax=Hydra vulgaris TaxID=6087 RepID=UPI001F5F8372|nr:uncharacterized protein LOC105845351 isoform X2 [Hydra vulgaris]
MASEFLYAIALIVNTFCVVKTYQVTLCQESSYNITCPANFSIKVLNATYGSLKNYSICASKNASYSITNLCNGANSCFIESNNQVFGGDPCPNNYKYTVVNYICYPQDCAQRTIGGKCCTFPFTYNGVTYKECTTVNYGALWCSLTTIYNGNWDNCLGLCYGYSPEIEANCFLSQSYTVTVYENTSYIITCGEQSLIRIKNAVYGSQERFIKCLSKNVSNFFQILCDRNSSCLIEPNNEMLGGDPCPYINKYILLDYICFLEGVWTQWSVWTNCNDTHGFINRTRDCKVSKGMEWCYGYNSEVLECFAFWTQWSLWSNCNSSYGFMNRTRICNVSNIISWCNGNNLEVKQCFVFWTQWSIWTNCNDSYGYMNRTRECSVSNAIDWCYGNNFEVINCFDISKSLWRISNAVSLQGQLLTLNLQIYPTFKTIANATVQFEYFLPPFFNFTAESVIQRFVRTDINKMKYSLSTQVESGNRSTFFKTFRQAVECFNYPSIPINSYQQVLKESYGRGVYWDEENSSIYACMNQHFSSTKAACFFSNDEENVWNALDVRIGSVLGRHLSTKELYAIHRNQKTYMMFHKILKKWLAITNEEFYRTAASFIDPAMRRNLEGDFTQVFTFGKKEWLGNAQGLFFRKSGNDVWTPTLMWRF